MTQINENVYDDSKQKKKKFLIIGSTSLILVAMVVGVVTGVRSGNGDKSESLGSGGQITTTSKSIQAICQPTNYKETCEQSLTKVAGNTTDPKQLVQAGFQVAIDALTEAINNSATLKELAKDPMASQALEICQELMDTAIDDLNRSFSHLESFDMINFQAYMDDLKCWLSATIAHQETCLDGFNNVSSEAGQKMKQILTLSSQLTSNGLAMVGSLSNILTDLNISGLGRRLMEAEDGVPSWVSPAKRRLLENTAKTITPDAVVAKDGSGQFTTINEAIASIPKKRNGTFVLYVKEGVYKEQVWVSRQISNLMLIGDGPTKTRITGDLNFANGVQTFKTSTFSVSGSDFMAKDIGFENTAGAIGHQAVAIRVQSDRAIFYNVHMDGYQDTLYSHSYRQFYRDCTISGTIDFIFGDSWTVFQNCHMVVRKPLDNQQCIVVASGRNDSMETTGFILQNCTISADTDYYPVRFKNKAYLARPWKVYSKTIIMQSQIDDLIDPQGFLPWLGDFGLDTLYYGEYQNRGAGSDTSNRVTWKGIRHVTPEEAEGYTPARFMDGDTWIPQTGVPYISGMISVGKPVSKIEEEDH